MSEINLKINLTYGDNYMSNNVTRDALLWQFICWGIFLPVISLIGIVGNALTIVVLWRKEMQSTTILYMRALVLTDTGILLTSVVVLTPFACSNYLHNDALRYFNENIYPILYTPINFTVMTLQSCNVWVTVSVSVERYIAICHPFKAARICTRRKTIVVLVAITLVSILYNIPRLFATYARECAEGERTSGNTCYYLADTELGKAYWYKTVYFSILYTVLIFVVPLAALFILNVFLIQELMRMQRRRSGTNIHDENEANLSLVLVLIVVVFIFCQSPGLVSQFDIFDFPVFLKWIAVSNLLFVINSAVNFLIYTAFGGKFRKVLLRVFRRLYTHSRGLSFRSSVVTANGYELTAIHDHQNTTVDSLDRTSSLADSTPCSKGHRPGGGDGMKEERTPLTSTVYCALSDGLAAAGRPQWPPVPQTGSLPEAALDVLPPALGHAAGGDPCRSKVAVYTSPYCAERVDVDGPCPEHGERSALVAEVEGRHERPQTVAGAAVAHHSGGQEHGHDARNGTSCSSSSYPGETSSNNNNKADFLNHDVEGPSRRYSANGPSVTFDRPSSSGSDVSSVDAVLLRVVPGADSQGDEDGGKAPHGVLQQEVGTSDNNANLSSELAPSVRSPIVPENSRTCPVSSLHRASCSGSSDNSDSYKSGIAACSVTCSNGDGVRNGDNNHHCGGHSKSHRMPLTRQLGLDAAANDRTPLATKTFNGRQENGRMFIKTDRYPIAHCLVSNGPIPADV